VQALQRSTGPAHDDGETSSSALHDVEALVMSSPWFLVVLAVSALMWLVLIVCVWLVVG
jgi:hypothetical protein